MDISLLPKFLQIELTYTCNSSCAFCYNPTHKAKIDRSNLETILSEVNTYHLEHVQLIGGEVTLLKELPSYLRLLPDVRWKSIVTNGRKFRPDIEGLIDEVYISIHGESKQHEIITNEPGSYRVIEENIKKYVSWGVDVNSDTVLTKYNADQIFPIARNAVKMGVKRLFLNIFQPEGIGSERPDFSPSLKQIRSAISQMIEAKEKLGIEMYFGTSTPLCLDERLITENLGFRCGAGSWFGSINPSGEMRICNHSTKSYGNIIETPLNKIWHNKMIDDDYRNAELEDGMCSKCPALKICRGGCRINEQGSYRVDPIVTRDKSIVLSNSDMARLLDKYNGYDAMSYS